MRLPAEMCRRIALKSKLKCSVFLEVVIVRSQDVRTPWLSSTAAMQHTVCSSEASYDFVIEHLLGLLGMTLNCLLDCDQESSYLMGYYQFCSMLFNGNRFGRWSVVRIHLIGHSFSKFFSLKTLFSLFVEFFSLEKRNNPDFWRFSLSFRVLSSIGTLKVFLERGSSCTNFLVRPRKT